MAIPLNFFPKPALASSSYLDQVHTADLQDEYANPKLDQLAQNFPPEETIQMMGHEFKECEKQLKDIYQRIKGCTGLKAISRWFFFVATLVTAIALTILKFTSYYWAALAIFAGGALMLIKGLLIRDKYKHLKHYVVRDGVDISMRMKSLYERVNALATMPDPDNNGYPCAAPPECQTLTDSIRTHLEGLRLIRV